MNEKTTQRIIEQNPKIFAQDFYFECDDGWADIIFNLCKELQQEIDNSDCEQIVAVQVKEKFAGLRFYASVGSEKTSEIIDKYSKLSTETCEMTGGRGYICEKFGWYKTLCPEAAMILGFKRCK